MIESTASAQADEIWQAMTSGDGRDKALRAMLVAPAAVQAIVMQRSADVAALFYATPEGEAELSDWRAMQGEDFAGYEDEEEHEAA